MIIRAAISPCPNDIFIFSGLISGQSMQSGDPSFEFEFHELESLNQGAQQGRWDLVKISYANFPICSSNYQLLRCGGAIGTGCGPLLLSNHENGSKENEILVPGKFTTANFLLDFYHGEKSQIEKNDSKTKVFLPFDEIYRRLLGPEPCLGVVIHEMRFTFAADGLRLIQDLGEFWEKKTGFPIPLGAVALRKTTIKQASISQEPQIQSKLEDCIRRSLAWAHAHRQAALEICRKHSQSISEAVLNAHIDLYVNAYSQDLGPKGDAAVAYFLECLDSSRTRP